VRRVQEQGLEDSGGLRWRLEPADAMAVAEQIPAPHITGLPEQGYRELGTTGSLEKSGSELGTVGSR
jgi:hypothetical protein